MPKKFRCIVFRVVLLGLCAVCLSGCQRSQKKDEATALYVDAISLSQSSDSNQAIDRLQQAVEKNPDFALAYSLMGNIYLQQNQFPESAKAYKKATEINPWSFEDFRQLGKAYWLMNDYNSAADAYATACKLDPQSTEVWCGAAGAYYKMGDYESALQFGQSAKELDPADSEVEKLMGDIYTARKDTEMAIGAYERAMELDNSDPNTMFALASAYLQDEKFEAAKELLDAVVAAQPENAEAWRYLGFVCLKMREVDMATMKYLKAVQLSPDDWRAHKGLGVAYMMKYRILKSFDNPEAETYKKQAIMYWSKSLDLNPAQDNLLKLYRKYAQ
jgi:cytochrome c-type biogenesis protein CcmH/NrfG